MFGDEPSSYILKKTLQLLAVGLFKYVWPFVTTKELFLKYIMHSFSRLIQKKKEKMETIKNGGEEGRANKSRGIRNFLRKVIILFHSYNTFFV